MAHPTIGQVFLLDVNRARVQHYPRTRLIALVNVRLWPFMAVVWPLLSINDWITISTLDSTRCICHHDLVNLLELGRVHGAMQLVGLALQGQTDDVCSD